MGNQERVIVGMSGGVDSSVAAALLKESGYDVIGVMLRLWSDGDEENRCCAPEAQVQARRIAGLIEIPFYVMDAKKPFYEQVVEPFVNGYAQGITPNPCLNCNRFIRWNFLLERAEILGASKIATGHYARINQSQGGRYQLLKNPDPVKDQSYFLYCLSQEQLSRTLFPLGEYSKNHIRELAAEFDLPVASRPDSQDLCFIGPGDYREYLRKWDESLFEKGPITDLQGNILGQHTGLADYTIGQRKGLGLSAPEPYYVINKNVTENRLIVGKKSELGKDQFLVSQLNWISIIPPQESIECDVKIRYQSESVKASVHPSGTEAVMVQLTQPLPDITPGQAAVFYQEDICLGGGIIQRKQA
jgi:tRNA-specific 2-thiouridylase